MKIYLGLGSNLGDKEDNINKAIKKIEERVGTILARSSFYYSKPQGFVSANDFVNAVVLCDSLLSPEELLHITQDIEKSMGRTRKSCNGKHFDRIIDIDILLYGNISINTSELQIPHPRIKERDFVMIPLREILEY